MENIDQYEVIKVIHIVSSTILFGTGIGTAFFMFRTHFTDDLRQKLYAARTTVLADYFFTLPSGIVQPVTGVWLVSLAGYSWSEFWLMATVGIYVIAGLCWLPVVWLQIEMKKMLEQAVQNDSVLPSRYFRLFRTWFLLGWPAFIGLVIVFYLMVAKPL